MTLKAMDSRFGELWRLHRPWLMLYLLFFTLGTLGDLLYCKLAPPPGFWAQTLPELHYMGVVFAATRFGAAVGLAAACAAAISNLAVMAMACSAPPQGAHPAMFAVIGLVAALTRPRRGPAFDESEPTVRALEERGNKVPLSELGRMMPELVHRFRTPIASIEGAGFVLEDADLSDEKRKEFVAIVQKECRRLELLVELLDFTQSRTSVDQEVDVTRLLDEVIGLCRPKADSGIVLRNTTRHDFPRLRCDRKLIKEAAHALTTNAIYAIAQNGELELSADLGPGEIVIRVHARSEQLDMPFDAPVIHKGNVIDLAIVQQIVGGHGGSVRMDPGARGGITFSMILPRGSG
jgi:signal transduction histidine kinase